MRMHHTIGACVAAASIVLGACQVWQTAADTVDDGPRPLTLQLAGDAPTGRFDISAGALVQRHEAQAQLDSARDALRRGHAAQAIPVLRTAARFFAGRAAPRTAAELERLADELQAGRAVSADEVIAASARANLAEADHHRAAAALAWGRTERTNTGDELVMAVDHLERALADAGRPVPATTRQALAEARENACALMRDTDPPRARVDASLAALRATIQAL